MGNDSSPQRLLVTGLGGFVGSHLARATAARGGDTCHPVLPDAFDVRDKHAVARAVADVRPDFVVHLAARSSIPEALSDPRATYEINFLGTLNLLEALGENGFSGRMLYVGSGDQYGFVKDEELPVRETQALRPRNAYGVSKVAAEALCFQWSQRGAFEIVMARPFNHIGPGQSPRFAIADFARQIARIALGRQPPTLAVGDIDVARDFTDVRDVAAAYLRLLDTGVNGEAYNVASGCARTVRDLVDRMVAIERIGIELVIDPARVRKAEQRRVVASHDKLTHATGWTPAIPIDVTLRDTLNWWKQEQSI